MIRSSLAIQTSVKKQDYMFADQITPQGIDGITENIVNLVENHSNK